MTHISHSAVTARESARHDTGKFGEQEHSTPEVSLPVEFASGRTKELSDVVAQRQKELGEAKNRYREQLILDLTRYLPANATRVCFWADGDDDGPVSLTFECVMTDDDDIAISKDMTDYLHFVGWEFGSPGDFAADEWLDYDADGYYVLPVGEEHALHLVGAHWAQRNEPGETGQHARESVTAWAKRAMRARAAELAAQSIHLRDENGTMRLDGFTSANGTFIPFDETDNDHRFIDAQAENILGPTPAADGGRLTLEV